MRTITYHCPAEGPQPTPGIWLISSTGTKYHVEAVEPLRQTPRWPGENRWRLLLENVGRWHPLPDDARTMTLVWDHERGRRK